jgi:hypothetical protein
VGEMICKGVLVAFGLLFFVMLFLFGKLSEREVAIKARNEFLSQIPED